jgi:hypothetical protein
MPNNNRHLPEPERQSITEATREAENRPLEFDPAERASYVRRLVQDIALWMSQGDSEEIIRERVPDFIEKYPELFKKIINRNDLSPIQTMLTMLDRMAEGTMSQHQASVVVGKRLVDRYVTPQLRGNGTNK